MGEENFYDKLRQECWDKALDSFAYSAIFSKRMNLLQNYIRLLTAFGILVPVAAGVVAISYAFQKNIIEFTISLAGILTGIQLLISICALIYRWDDNMSYAMESSSEHATLSNKYKKLAGTPPSDIETLKRSMELLDIEYDARSHQDMKAGIKEREKRMGMKFGLREFQRKCVGCGIVPISVKSTECDVCGKFSIKYKYFKS